MNEKLPALDRYDRRPYLRPYWSGEILFQESVMALEKPNGSVPDIPLLYPAEELLSVRSSDLKIQYQPGRDYLLAAGRLRIPAGSAIPTVPYEIYYPKTGEQDAFSRSGGGWIYFSEGSRLHGMQLAVTYRHAGQYPGEIPPCQGDRLPNTLEKLQSGGRFRVVVYGDSISTGLNSTGPLGAAPYVPAWYELFLSVLEERYPLAALELVNPSAAGTTSEWGAVNAGKLAAAPKPDLCIVGFGMNDGSAGVLAAEFQKNIRMILNTVKKDSPDCEFILLSTMLPNREVAGFYGCQEDYLPALEALAGIGVAVADMTGVHKALLKRKRYCDMTGNNVNHPNDFLARAYAQLLCRTVLGEWD